MKSGDEKIIRALWNSYQQEQPCILCNAMTYNRGLYIPNDPQAFGAPFGKDRTFIYAFCGNHPDNDETTKRIETFILENHDRSMPVGGT